MCLTPNPRWWLLGVVVGGAAVAVAVVQLGERGDRQAANLLSLAIGVGALALAFVWLVLFSRLAARTRLVAAAGALAVVALLAACLRIRGVTGDLLPIFEWRWSEPAPPAAAAGAAPGAGRAVLEPVPGLAPYPQFFGPGRDGELAGPALARDWNARPPVELWRRDVGEGWSGFAVAGRRAITQEQHGEDEAVVCYDVASGEVLWVHRDRARYFTTLAGLGPRATPTIAGERVFAQGATGILNCLDLATGAVRWSKDILEDNGAPLPDWGVAGSPLAVGARVVVSAGGPNGRSLVAYDQRTGRRVWSGGSDAAHWSSPVLATLAGVEQILVFNATAVAAHDPADGSVLWTHPWKTGHPHVCLPLALEGDRVFVSSGYGTGCQLVRIERDRGGGLTARPLWRSLSMKAKFTNVVEKDGFVYGLDDGILACVDLATGRRRWKRGRYGHGQVILVGELLLVTTETGEVVLVEPVPEEPRELTRLRAFDAKTWNPPALAGELLLVRNDRHAACYRLPTRDD